MGIHSAELAAQRRVTRAFIQADSKLVTLLRAARVPDGAGGVVEGDPVSLPVQTMRLIPLGRDGAQERFTANGEAVQPTYALLGEHTADVQRWDQFILDGARYEVVFIHENRQYELKAEVAYRG